MVTETKEQAFAYQTSELARGLVIMPGDSKEVKKCKRDRGFCVDLERGFLSINDYGEWIRLNITKSEIGIRKGFLLSTSGFETLLMLAAHEDYRLLEDMELTDEEVRASLYCGAEKLILHNRLLIVGFKLDVPIWDDFMRTARKLDENGVAACERLVDTLSRFQGNLLQRISPPSPDIRNK